MSEPTVTGWWSVQGDLDERQFQEARAAIIEANAKGQTEVVVKGVTFTWHPLDVMTEDRIRADALREAAERVRALDELSMAVPAGLRSSTSTGYIDKSAVLAILEPIGTTNGK